MKIIPSWSTKAGRGTGKKSNYRKTNISWSVITAVWTRNYMNSGKCRGIEFLERCSIEEGCFISRSPLVGSPWLVSVFSRQIGSKKGDPYSPGGVSHPGFI